MTRKQWIYEVAGDMRTAVEFEQQALSIGRERLPPCALAVLDGANEEPEPAYWRWLADQFTKASATA